MSPLRITTAAEQVATHLRDQLARKVWVDIMPGSEKLARQLGVGRMTVDAALGILEKEGWLVTQGERRRRKIVVLDEDHHVPSLRVAILLYEPSDASMDLVMNMKLALQKEEHTAFYLPRTLVDIKMDVRKLASMVNKEKADAWIVLGGTEEILRWFTKRKMTVFAFFGRFDKLEVAGVRPNSKYAITKVVKNLVSLGHKKIILLDSHLSVMEPSDIGTAFLKALQDHDIATGPYNMPGWGDGGYDAMYDCLESLFLKTPPTAIILCSRQSYFAALHFLLDKDIHVPRDLSLVCMDADPHFEYCRPSVAHCRWRKRAVINSVVSWMKNISQGKPDTRKIGIDTDFIEGGTIGPAS